MDWLKRLQWNLNPVGLGFGAAGLLLSLTPSLLPRDGVLQGLVSGLVFGISYAVGTGFSRLFERLTGWRPSATARRWGRIVGWPLFGVLLVVAGFAGPPRRRRSAAWWSCRRCRVSTSSGSSSR